MNKKKRVKVAASVAMSLLLAGCGKGTDGMQDAAAIQEQSEEYVYEAEYQSLTMPDYYTSSMIFGEDEKIYFVGNSEAGESRLFSMEIGDMEPQAIPVEIKEQAHISCIGTDVEGNLVLAIPAYKEQTAQEDGESTDADSAPEEVGSILESVELRKLSTEGQVLESVDVSNFFNKIKDFYIQGTLSDKDGNYYVNANQTVYVIRPTGEMLCEIPAKTYIQNMFRIRDGRIIVGFYDSTGWRLQEVDLAGKSLVDVNSSIPFDYGTYQGGKDVDLVYTQETKLYTCNLTDQEPIEVLNWLDSDINSTSLQSVQMLGDGRIAAITIDYMSESPEAELVVLTKKNRSQVQEKTVLTYGTIYVPYFLNKDIVAFNKQSDKYRIEVKLYGDDSMDFEERTALLSADLAAGKGPDMIDMVYGFLTLEQLVSMGIAEDLTPYLEGDTGIKREEYLENVMDVYSVDGKIYAIMPCFSVGTLIGKVSDVGNGSSWSIDDMIKFIDSKPADVEILPFNTKDSILQLMCSMNLGVFVDAETGVCDFTGEEFLRILEFANRFPKEMAESSGASSQIDRLRSGQLLMEGTRITDVTQYQMYEYMFGEEVNFIGYPTTEGSGSVINPNGTTAAMNAKAENKEGIWEFLRFNLLQERQENLESANGGFPISKSALEKQFAKDAEAEYYEDTDGTKKEVSKVTWSWGDGDSLVTVDVYAATQEQIGRMKAIIEAARGIENIKDEKMFSIISEEAQSYFEGQKSAQETASLIQNRVQTYINETR